MAQHAAHRKRLPATRIGLTKKKRACGFKFWVTVNFYEESGEPGEVFITIAKEGSAIAGFVDVLALTMSVALQYGVPWEVLKEKYLHTRFGDGNDTENPSLVHAFAVAIDETVAEHKASQSPAAESGTIDSTVTNAPKE